MYWGSMLYYIMKFIISITNLLKSYKKKYLTFNDHVEKTNSFIKDNN